MKTISVPFDTIDEIYHLADVHIRLFKRHDEYREVFSRLYEQFKSNTSKNRVIVVAGDIVHAKTDMSPEMLELASEFLKSLADIAPTIIIAGNHDLNLSNMNRLDSLTPIVKSLNHSNLTYLKHSGIYQMADVDFAVFSILDEQSEWPTTLETRPTAKKVALFHGPVNGAQTDTNYVITNRHVDVSSFDGFDIALLGDIHKYQVMQHRSAGKPAVVYASSLIQQSHGETVSGHGWCKWDLHTFNHVFVPVANDYGYYTLEIEKDQVTIPSEMPKNVRLRLFVGNADASVVKKVTATIRTTHNIIELSINKTTAETTPLVASDADASALDVTNVNTQNSLIQDWIERTHESVDDDLMKKIIDINTKLNTTIAYDDQSRNVHWRPVKFTFSNMFSYGDKNEINFNDMSGIYGIFAPNATGKSSSIDALMFCLYDKTPRAFRGDHIMNNRRESFECELQLEINDQSYFIRRTGTKKKNGDVKVDVSFWKEEPDGSQTSLNGEDRRATNAIIRNYVGTYEDFVLTSLSSQNASALFIDKSHSERKDLLIQFMGLNIFDVLHDTAKEQMKEVTTVLKKFSKEDFTQTLADTQTEIERVRTERVNLEQTRDERRGLKDRLYQQMKTLQESRKPLPVGIVDIISARKQYDVTVADIENTTAALDRLRLSLNNNIERKSNIEAQVNALDTLEMQASHSEYLKVTTSIQTERHKLDGVEVQLKLAMAEKASLDRYKFDPDCEFCVVNGTTHIKAQTANFNKITELENQKTASETFLRTLEVEQDVLSLAYNQYEGILKLKKELALIETEIERTELQIESTESKLETLQIKKTTLEADIQLATDHAENVKINKKLEEQLSFVEYDIKTATRILDELEKKVRDNYGKLSVLEASKADIIAKIKEAEELEDTYEAYKYYMSAVGRDGVPHEIMSKAIPTIQNEINGILTQIADFTITLEVDGKNILGRLNYDHERIWPLENSSGMERFISSIAIRVALLKASNLPKPNFLIIDEGMGALDVENLGSMATLFGILKTEFDFMIVISHLDAVRDMVDKVLDIKREDGFSYINV